ncbi:MAG: dTDP-4-dehydrorhamnose reductase [Bacteroidales bacterium]|nr:dTDP-4-dehydrorhamnose reductase [Bacteroidales bacterium]
MNLLITGANGQLGSEIRALHNQFTQHRFYFTDADTLDITDEGALDRFTGDNHIDMLINCAAYTAVDKAEEEKEKAMLLNGTAPATLGAVCRRKDITLLHVSTDYVFSGKTYVPYEESMDPDPMSAYGLTKLAGERAMKNSGAKGAIIRTSWLYSAYGNNFVKTMLRLGAEKEQLQVVFDQVGSPTYAGDLAYALLLLTEKPLKGMEIYHYANEGVCSWYDMAVEIMNSRRLPCHINPIETKDYPTPAMRPPYSVFNKAKIKQFLNISIPHWRESLNRCLENL